jgi:beta-glucosidase
VNAEVTVTNTGSFRSDEVVELYLVHEHVGIVSPLYSLKGFKRISIDPGKSAVVKFTVSPEMLSLINANGQPVQLPGKIKISVGGSLPSKRSEDLGAAKHVEAILVVK